MGATSAGCWTCRIRHRKCDETRPACRECDTRGITCHGYGGKPQWMDDDTQLHKELASIKKAVKDNFRRIKRLHAKRASKEENRVREASQNDRIVDTIDAVTFTTTDSIVSQEASYRESELAAYYLDYLFPFLYPYYKCDPLNGGRGWLFWLLSHNPPLRKAALAVAALHQRASSRPEDRGDETELLLYHTSALSGLRQALCITGEIYLTDDPDEFIKLLACGCSLISFEVKPQRLLPSLHVTDDYLPRSAMESPTSGKDISPLWCRLLARSPLLPLLQPPYVILELPEGTTLQRISVKGVDEHYRSS